MAILVNIEFRGVRIDNAYATVSEPAISVNKTELSFCVYYRAGSENDPITSEMLEAPYDLNGGNPYIQAYAHLKSLPEFVGCEDC